MTPFDASSWLESWAAHGDRPAFVGDSVRSSYAGLALAVARAAEAIEDHGVERGAVVALPVGFSGRATALMLALARHGCVAAPVGDRLSPGALTRRCALAGVTWHTVWSASGGMSFERESRATGSHALVDALRACGRPGLVLFTSGTTGEAKAVLHDLALLLDSFELRERAQVRVLPLLFPDHIGGFDVLWRGLAAGATIVRPPERGPESVARAVEAHGVEVIAASPSQLGFLLASGVLEPRRFASVRLIAHGAEPMPKALLDRLRDRLPHVRFEERFGTSETGAVRVRVREPGSPWFTIDSAVGWRVQEGELWLRVASRALGYLNTDGGGRFTDDGWYRTGDLVEVVEDRWIRILGRRSEMINVGGAKVMPAEVEAVLMEMRGVTDCTVAGEPHAMTGQVVVAEIVWFEAARDSDVLREVRRHCRGRLAAHAVPVKVRLRPAPEMGALKKRRLPLASPGSIL